MLGVFLFFVYFILFCLLIRLPTRQKMRNITSVQVASPTSFVQEFSQDTDKDMAWWVKIVTETPKCTYFFGPFESANEAKYNESGYVEDLEQEGATGIEVCVLQDRPQTLTIYDEQD